MTKKETKEVKKTIKCECCKREIEAMFRRKYCSPCAVYLTEIKKQLGYHRKVTKDLKILLYGQEKGSMRLKFKEKGK